MGGRERVVGGRDGRRDGTYIAVGLSYSVKSVECKYIIIINIYYIYNYSILLFASKVYT